MVAPRVLAAVAAGLLLGPGLTGIAQAAPAATVTGVGVGPYDPNIDWGQLKAQGVEYAYIEDTTGTENQNASFTEEYDGARAVGMLVGAVHFGLPDQSTGTAQADYLLAHGGGWSAGQGVLPPTLDIEFNPYGATCYGLSEAAMVNWITQFTHEIHTKTTRWPVIYTDPAWWNECTGGSAAFAADDPLWTTAGTALPGGFPTATFRSSPTGTDVGYAGTLAQLTAFANG